MKKMYSFLVVMLLVASTTMAQQTVVIEPGFGKIQEAIAAVADSAAGATTTFELKRDGIYYLDGSIENSDFQLTLVAQDGDGARPQLIPGVPTGGESSRAFRARNNLTLKGLYITNRDENGGMTATRIIRCSADDIVITIDDCHLDNDLQAALRLDDGGMKVYISNSIISNIGSTTSPNNGRVIDDRGNEIDELVIENTTMYNISSRVLRDDGGVNNMVKVNHCTMVNIGQRGITLNETKESIITNNQFINCGFFGNNDVDDPYYLVELDTLDAQTAVITNNNFYIDPAFITAQPDTVYAAIDLNPLALAFADEATFLNEDITFNTPPPSVLPLMAYWTDPENTPDFDRPDTFTYDFGYTSGMSAIGGIDGAAIGDENWTIVYVGINENNSHSNIALNCYPNPVQGDAVVSFTLENNAIATLEIINVTGARVKTIYSGDVTMGENTFTINSNNLESGIYFVRLTANGISSANKFVVK